MKKLHKKYAEALWVADLPGTSLDVAIIARGSIRTNRIYEIHKMATSSGDSRIEQYKKLRSDCDKQAYSVKALDQIGNEITSALSGVIGQLSKNLSSKNNIDSGIKNISTVASVNRCNLIKTAKNDFFKNKINAEAELIKAAKKNNIIVKSIDEIYYEKII
jgi:hypothetical protein